MDKRVFDPTTSPQKRPMPYAPRPKSLNGKRVGLVDNTKFNSDRLLQKIGEILEKEYGVQRVLIRSKNNPTEPAHEEILSELSKECDVIIAGIGD